jgi:hypothetical protein
MLSRPSSAGSTNAWPGEARRNAGGVRLGSSADIGGLIMNDRSTPKADMFSLEIHVR